MGEFSAWHWLIIALVFLVLFGATKLPVFAKSLGESMRIFKKEIKSDDAAAPADAAAAPAQAQPAAPQALTAAPVAQPQVSTPVAQPVAKSPETH